MVERCPVFRAGLRDSGEFLIPLCLRILPFLQFTSPSGMQRHGSSTTTPSLRVRVRVCACVCPRGRVTVSQIDKVSWQRQQFLVNTGAGLAPQINDAASLSKRTVCKRCRIPKLNLFSDALFWISTVYRVLAFYAIETFQILFQFLKQIRFSVNFV